MSAELEGRIRASLSAYADLVEEGEAADVVLPVRRRAPAARRWRAPVLVAAAVAAVVSGTVWIGAAWFGASDPAGSATVAAREGGDAGAERAEGGESADEGASAFTVPDGAADAAAAPPSEIGVAVPFDLYTHCGVLGADIAGVWFAADSPLVDGPGSPPPGWGDPYQPGTMTLLSADEAVFRDDVGHELLLRADEASRPPPCA